MTLQLETRHLSTILKALAYAKRKAVSVDERNAYSHTVTALFSQLTEGVVDRDTIERKTLERLDRIGQQALQRAEAIEWEMSEADVRFLAHRG